MTTSFYGPVIERACLIAVFTLIAAIPSILQAQLTPGGGLNNFVENALNPLEDKMHERVERHAEAAKFVEAPVPPAPDPRQQRVVDDLITEMMVQKGDTWFSQYLGSGLPVPVQFKEFEILGPFSQSVAEKEKAAGVDQKFTYTLKAASHRHFRKPHGWGPWQPGNPIYFSGITVVQTQGRWEIQDSPAKSYSLLRQR